LVNERFPDDIVDTSEKGIFGKMKEQTDMDLDKVPSGGCVPIAQEPISRSTIFIKIFIYLIIMGYY